MARVLLVEDEPAICMLLVDALSDEGHVVDDALTIAEAEAALERLLPELEVLVTDINVEVRGWGFGFAARARDLNPRLAVIYITGDSEALVSARGVGGAVTLPKPFLPRTLLGAIERVTA